MNKENNSEDFTFLCLNAKKVKVLIVGGGTSALVKAKSFLKKGFTVHCIAPSFKEELFSLKSEKLKITIGNFEDYLINTCHLVVICTSDNRINKHIRELCDSNCKVYIDTTIPEESMATLCAMTSSKETSVGVRLKGKSPKTSQFLANKIKNYIATYDDYISFVTELRRRMKDFPKRLEVLDFVSSEDFLFFFQRSYGEKVLDLFYGGESIEFENSYKKE